MGSRSVLGRVRKISSLLRFDPRTVQPVASRYTYWAIPVHTFCSLRILICATRHFLLRPEELYFAMWVSAGKSQSKFDVYRYRLKDGITTQDKLFSVVQGSFTTGTVAATCHGLRQKARNIFLVDKFWLNISQNFFLASSLTFSRLMTYIYVVPHS